MTTLTKPQISNKADLEDIEALVRTIHSETFEQILGYLIESPLWLLEDMKIVAKFHDNKSALKIIQEGIARKLKSQVIANKDWAKEVQELYSSTFPTLKDLLKQSYKKA